MVLQLPLAIADENELHATLWTRGAWEGHYSLFYLFNWGKYSKKYSLLHTFYQWNQLSTCKLVSLLMM